MINNKKVVATIRARMNSTRLPGKVLMPLAGKPVLAHMIERHKRSRYTDEVVVATTDRVSDDPVVALCKELGCKHFRGSESDVFSRLADAGRAYHADILVDGMADTPLVDPEIIDTLIEMLLEGGYDCTSNEFDETYPTGLDARVFLFETFERAEKNDTDPVYREHAGYSIRDNPNRFKLGNLTAQGDMHWPTLRLTLDTKEDYELIARIYDKLYPLNQLFDARDVIAFLKTRPDLVAINASVVQHIPIPKS